MAKRPPIYYYEYRTIEYYYTEKNDAVWYVWRWAGTKRWHWRKTPQKQIPYVIMADTGNFEVTVGEGKAER